jgi:PAS domain S-box-containing protein
MPEPESRAADESQFEEQIRLLEFAHDAIIVMDADRVITGWNSGAREIYGYTAAEAAGCVIHDLLQTRGKVTSAEVDAVLAREGRWDGELTHIRKDGAAVDVESRQVQVRPAVRRRWAILEINRDITQRKRSEAAILESQKFESLGVLAGGLAHQFNNMLTSIMGNASLALEELDDHPAGPLIAQVLESADAAANLTRQMLAYSGKGRFVVDRVAPESLIRESLALVRPSVPKTASLILEVGEPPAIDGDRMQLEQLIINLVLNAAEALPDAQGEIRILAGARRFYPGGLPQQVRGEARPGRFFQLHVEDTGTGMAPADLSQAFDPFFSTKFAGRGLGLPAVLGIVRGHGGFLEIHSRPGEGTAVDVYLPAAE